MRNDKVRTITYMALMMALATVATIAVRIPVPATQGYVHFGDTVLILSVLILGKKKGAAAGALGQALADILGGYAVFAPITFVAKILMGLLIGTAIEMLIRYKSEKKGSLAVSSAVFTVLSCAAMAGTYYIAESVMYSSF
ncbi:MAG: ECF transporter S component, partial [Bacillota bacterium]|nr:ECF transporter S component [Bacillota bacterium]